jgi:hypothetical protein
VAARRDGVAPPSEAPRRASASGRRWMGEPLRLRGDRFAHRPPFGRSRTRSQRSGKRSRKTETGTASGFGSVDDVGFAESYTFTYPAKRFAYTFTNDVNERDANANGYGYGYVNVIPFARGDRGLQRLSKIDKV